MAQKAEDKKARKAALKALRMERKQKTASASAIMKTQKEEMGWIRGQLQKGEATVPDIAAGAGMSADRVLWYLMAMKKYGEVVEAGKQGAYFAYTLAEPQATESRKKEGEV